MGKPATGCASTRLCYTPAAQPSAKPSHSRSPPVAVEPEPALPADLQQALADHPAARTTWDDITPLARRDWIFWITSGKKAETRSKRIHTACDMLASGKRRACCFDRSGMYSKALSAPKVADE